MVKILGEKAYEAARNQTLRELDPVKKAIIKIAKEKKKSVKDDYKDLPAICQPS